MTKSRQLDSVASFRNRSLQLALPRRPQTETKLFGKYNDIVMLLFGFFLSGIVGTYIAQAYTTRNADFDCLNTKFDLFLNKWHAFSFRLAEAIQQDKVGTNRPTLNVPQSERPGVQCVVQGAQHSTSLAPR